VEGPAPGSHQDGASHALGWRKLEQAVRHHRQPYAAACVALRSGEVAVSGSKRVPPNVEATARGIPPHTAGGGGHRPAAAA